MTGQKGKAQHYSGTAQLYKRLTSNAFIIITCAHNFEQYRWDNLKSEYVKHFAKSMYMLLGRNGLGDDNWTAKLKVLDDYVRINKPY